MRMRIASAVFFLTMLLAAVTHVQSSSQSGGIKSISEKDATARLVHRVEPTYPDDARKTRIEGSVVLAITVATDGSVKSLKAVSGSPLLVPAAALAVRQWRYKPYVVNGKPTEVETTVTVPFAIEKPVAQAAQPSPQPTSPDPNLVATMKDLEQKLRAIGTVTWSQNAVVVQAQRETVGRRTLWARVAEATTDPETCLLKVRWETNGLPWPPFDRGGITTGSFYLDEIPSVDVLTSENYLHQWHMVPQGQPDYKEDAKPAFFPVVFTHWSGLADFKFPTKDAAEQFAAAMRDSIMQCSAAPVQPPTTGGPGLAETLSFIADKLSGEGPVKFSYSGIIHGKSDVPIHPELSVNYFRVTPSRTSCSVAFDSVHGNVYQASRARLSLRRVSKIEVMALKEYLASTDEYYVYATAWTEAEGKTSTRNQITDASPITVLKISEPGVEPKALYFSDELLANRVGKAMEHAALLCGAGSKPEPF